MSDPPDGSIDRPLDQRVRLDFSEAIDPASLFFGAFQVSQPGTSSLSLGSRRLSFVPSGPLPPSTTVLVELTEDVSDVCGNPLSIPGGSVRVEMLTSAQQGRGFRPGDDVKIEISPETSVLLPEPT